MQKTKEFINDILKNTHISMLKAEIYVEVIEDIFNSTKIYTHIREQLDYLISYEVGDTIYEVARNVESYKNKMEKEL